MLNPRHLSSLLYRALLHFSSYPARLQLFTFQKQPCQQARRPLAGLFKKNLVHQYQAPAAASANTLRAHRTFRAAPQVSIQPALAFHIHPGDGRHLESRALETRSAKPERSPGETERSAPLLPGCPSDIPGSRCTPSAAPHLVLLCTSSCPAQEPRF